MFSPSVELPLLRKDSPWATSPASRLPPSRSERNGKSERGFPRIVLRDSLGNKLDTFTYLQEAIYRAEWNVKNSHEAVLPEEWRLPKAPNPARPDYSRAAPPLANTRARLKLKSLQEQEVSRSLPHPRFSEIDVNDVAFVAESLNQLPRVPSLSFLHHDLLAEPKKYFQIVHQALVQQRYYAQTDKRERVYNFPGFCMGCRRSGLCYGCERSSAPHYHIDRIMKTGGGFTYHKHDHPIRERPDKNPSNWKLAFPELALKHLIQEHENGSENKADEDVEVAEKMNEATRGYQLFNQKAPSDYGHQAVVEHIEEDSVGTQEEIVKQWAMMREEPLIDDRERGQNKNNDRLREENMDAMSPWTDPTSLNKELIDENLFRGESHTTRGSEDITIRMESQGKQDYKDSSTDQGSQQLDVQDQRSEHSDRDGSGSVRSEHELEDPVQNQTDNDADSEGEDDDTMKSSTKRRDKSYTSGTTGKDSQKSSKLGTTPNSGLGTTPHSRLGTTPHSNLGTTPHSTGDTSDKRDRPEDKSEKSGSSPYSPYSSRRRKPLYKECSSPSRSPTPPPFKIKHQKNRQIDSHSPFSTERHYDLPKGSGFQVKKSEKKLTEFKEFKHHEGNWKEPEKFTVKKSDKHSTDFWSPPKKKEAKKKERVKKQVRPVSPDSGLESEKPTGMKLESQPHLFPLTEHELNVSEVKEGNQNSSDRSDKHQPNSAVSHISIEQRNESEHKKIRPQKTRGVSLDSSKKANKQIIVCLNEEALDGETKLNINGCCNEEDFKGKSKQNNTYESLNNKVFDKRNDQNIVYFDDEAFYRGTEQNDECHDEEALKKENKQNNAHVHLDNKVLDEINGQNIVSIGDEAWDEKNKQILDSDFEESKVTSKALTCCQEEDLSKDNKAHDKPTLVKKTSKTEMAPLPDVRSISEKCKNLPPAENVYHFENQTGDLSTVENSEFPKSKINGTHAMTTRSRNSKSSSMSDIMSTLENRQIKSKQILNSGISFQSVGTEKDFREKKDLFERRLRIVQGSRKRRPALTEMRSVETKKTGPLLHDKSVDTIKGESHLHSVETKTSGFLLHAGIQIDTPTEILSDTPQKPGDDAGLLRDILTAKYSAQELPLKSPALIEAEQVLSPPLQKPISPVDEGTLPSLATPIVEQPKKERPKKTRKEVPKKPPSPVRSITPKSPEPVVEEVQVTLKSREPTPEHVPTPTPKITDLPPVDIPPLPEITEEKKEKKPKVDNRKPFEPIQVMPKIKDAIPPPPKKSKPPTITKKSLPKKRVPSAEAPVTTEEIRQMKDPLDFLAKYCIISKDRLPYYERIYKNIVSSQPERYERAHPLSPTTGMPVTEGTSWGNHELNMFHDLVLISRGQDPPRPALSEPEQYLEKICYTLEMLDGKHRQLAEDLNLLESKRIQQLAERARKLVPDITSVHFKKKEKKSKKKKKKKNKVEQEEVPAKVILSRADITDDVIVSRIEDKLLKKLMKEPAQHQLNCEIERCTEKLANIEDRLIQLEGEKNIIGMYCMELFFEAQNDNNKPREFRRQQSFLYKTLHPDPDVEMNKEELEGALQIVNHNLLSQNEFSYLYHILNLTGRRKINFKLFCVIAALSERITHMDPVIRELLNKEKGWKRQSNDYESLDVRLNRSKELFQLLDEGDSVPFGNALASSLAVELTAGGLSPELTSYVMGKFNREGKGYVDFLDYVTYVPLFIEIHEKIINDPLCSTVRIQ